MTNFNIKPFGIVLAVAVVILTVGLCVSRPKMHKAFQMNIIEYVMKINTDGSVSTTKNVTTTVVKEKQ